MNAFAPAVFTYILYVCDLIVSLRIIFEKTKKNIYIHTYIFGIAYKSDIYVHNYNIEL